jgi:hypothetical protein
MTTIWSQLGSEKSIGYGLLLLIAAVLTVP